MADLKNKNAEEKMRCEQLKEHGVKLAFVVSAPRRSRILREDGMSKSMKFDRAVAGCSEVRLLALSDVVRGVRHALVRVHESLDLRGAGRAGIPRTLSKFGPAGRDRVRPRGAGWNSAELLLEC